MSPVNALSRAERRQLAREAKAQEKAVHRAAPTPNVRPDDRLLATAMASLDLSLQARRRGGGAAVGGVSVRHGAQSGEALRVAKAMGELSLHIARGETLETFFFAQVQASPSTALALIEHLERKDVNHDLPMAHWRAMIAYLQGKSRTDIAAELSPNGPSTWMQWADAGLTALHFHTSMGVFFLAESYALDSKVVPVLETLAACFDSVDEVEDAFKLLDEAQLVGALSFDALALRGDLHLREDRFDEAQADYAACLRLANAAQQHAAIYSGMAVIYAVQGNVDRATQAFNKAFNAKDEAPRAIRNLVRAAAIVGDPALLDRCKQRLLQGAHPSTTYAVLAEAYVAQGRTTDALDVYKAYTHKDPKSAAAWFGQASVLNRLQDPIGQVHALAQAVALDGGNAAAHILYGQALLPVKNGALGAQQAYSRALALSPGNVAATAGMAEALAAQDLHDQSAEWWSRACTLQPDSVSNLNRFIDVATHTPAYAEQSLWALRQLQAMGVHDPSRCLKVAQLLRHKDPAAATAVLQEAVARDADNSALQQALQETEAQVLRRLLQPIATQLPGAGVQVKPRPLSFVYNAATVTGMEIGQTFDGRSALLTDQQELYWGPYGLGSAVPALSALASLRHGCAYKAPEALAERFARLLDMRIAGHATAKHYLQALTSNHGECFLGGGAVRDLLGDIAHATVKHLPQINDLDFVTPYAPHRVLELATGVAPSVLGLGNIPGAVQSARTSQYFGLVKFGDGTAAGLDVVSMRAYGAYAPMALVKGAQGRVLPLAFGPDIYADALNRDFTVNTLLYDFERRLIIDPLGRGFKDVVAKRLVLCSKDTIYSNEDLGFRYVKMRQKDYETTPETSAAIDAHFGYYFQQPNADAWLARALRRARSARDRKDTIAWLQGARTMLLKDGIKNGLTVIDAALAKL